MELREWLIILGLVLVAIIVVDGVRRLQRQRKVPRLDEVEDDDRDIEDPDEAARRAEVNWELPNGGARVVSPASKTTVEPKPDLERQEHPGPSRVFARMKRETAGTREADTERPAQAPRARRDEDETTDAPSVSMPLHAEREDAPHREDASMRAAAPADAEDEAQAPRGGFDVAGGLSRSMKRVFQRRERDDEAREADEPAAAEPAFEMPEAMPEREPAPEFEAASPEPETPAAASEAAEDAPLRDDVVTPHPVVEKARRHPVSARRAREALGRAEDVIVISVMARDDEGFAGTDLLRLMLACGLRYSDMGIFLRNETEDADSALQFAMVDVVKPGTFALETMDDYATPGITFLMPLPGARDSAAAFEAMVETAMVVVRNLGGELKDENHSVMTAQTVEFARQQVQEFERRHRLHRSQAT
ncbi:cell division protein ZipA [Modicisalibacter tunisiensis]|uniref:cell division protein ZipA C-terminal FtsZ-binding domain-containing protein n=1 Tax=Modicisalibacter tunisiensis TaxID=390637 RepID=UPI001CCF4F81|nr:cell division protein ZipA C-terminal FtsZ-binding domain-containing protein [Modicisalibacter tunisiensis]MBZ9540197.1 cell division protein ZipA [Modicisalibacter tunisiensis]